MIKDMKDSDIKVVGISNSKSKDKTNWKVMGAIIGIVVLALGVIAGIILVRQNQNISEKAKECNLGGYACPDPNNSSLLRDCSTGEEFPNDSLCNSAGRVEVCGSTASNAKQFCCPSAGAAWTTNLTLCSVAATPTPTATATATATASPTATNTSKATATSTTKATATSTSASKTTTPTSTSSAQATATTAPIPVTGASWPTIVGGGFGVIMVLISLSLAL
ncbi:MAG: hypothetical protein AAB559_03080 [Patescibacteria group bacterium]